MNIKQILQSTGIMAELEIVQANARQKYNEQIMDQKKLYSQR